jgi:hypothetical protein
VAQVEPPVKQLFEEIEQLKAEVTRLRNTLTTIQDRAGFAIAYDTDNPTVMWIADLVREALEDEQS